METRQLRYFLAIASDGSFTDAARRIGIAQPALSTQIAKLEIELGCALFHRRPHGIELTPAGERFRVHATGICERMSAALRETRRDAGESCIELTLGIPALMSPLLIAPLMEAVRSEIPQVSLRVREGMGAALRDMLSEGQLDLAVLYKAPAETFRNEALLFEEDLYLGTAPGREISAIRPLTAKDLAGIPLVLSTPGNSHRELLEHYSRREGFALKIAAEVDSLSGQRELVIRGLGSAVLPRSGFWGWPEGSVDLIKIEDDTLVSRAIIVSRAEDTAASLLVRDLTRDVAKQLITKGSWPDARAA
jgi:LysR family nitrogen assimilation transcriptional regulator